MKRPQLEHVLRAAARIVNQPDFLVVGSAAILATYDEAMLPVEATRSDEADLACFNDDAANSKGLAIEGSLGEGSMFHRTHGYYADGVEVRTAITPEGWQKRLVRFEPPGAEPGRGWCLEPHDLAAAKLAAGRAKDYEFVGALLREGLINESTLRERIDQLPANRVLPIVRREMLAWIDGRSRPRGRQSGQALPKRPR